MEHENRKIFELILDKKSFQFGFGIGVVTVVVLAFGFAFMTGRAIFTKSASSASSEAPNSIALNSQPKPSDIPSAKAATPTSNPPVVSAADHILGDKNAPVTFVEYSDFECPFCKRFAPTMQRMMQEYSGKVRLVYRHFPLPFHANAEKEAEAVECANALGGNNAFWKYHDAILARTTSNGTGFPLDNLVPLAKELGLSQTNFKSCLDSGKYASHVQQDEAGGQSAGVTGTPGSFLIGKDGNAQLISGAVPYETIKAAIDLALQ